MPSISTLMNPPPGDWAILTKQVPVSSKKGFSNGFGRDEGWVAAPFFKYRPDSQSLGKSHTPYMGPKETGAKRTIGLI